MGCMSKVLKDQLGLRYESFIIVAVTFGTENFFNFVLWRQSELETSACQRPRVGLDLW